MERNEKFRLELIKRFGTQSDAAVAIHIDESCVSALVRGRRRLTEGQRKKLLAHFSPYKLRQFFPPSQTGGTEISE
jgi:hypothetical protein